MRRNFSLNLIFLLALNLLVKPFYLFGIEVGVQNTVGAEEYGLYYAMFNFTFLFNVLLDMGINNYQKIKVAQDAESGMKNMATLLPMKLGLSLVYMLVTVTFALIVGFEGRYWFFIGWLMLNHVLSVFLLLLRANMSGLHLFVRDSILSVTDRLLLIVAIGYLLWFRDAPFEIETFVLFQTAAYASAILLALFLTPSIHRNISWNIRWSSIWSMTKETWPFALLILLMTAYNKIDGIMLERLAQNGTLEAGIYAQAFRILDAGNSFAFLYGGLLLPMFAKLLRQSDGIREIKTLIDRSSKLLIIPAGVVFLVSFFYADWLMHLLYDAHADESAQSLQWLMGSFVFLAIGYVFGTLITASSDLRALNWIALATVVLNVVLNVIMIPTKGAEGAALTSFTSLGFMALSQLIHAYRTFEFNWQWLWKSALVWGLTLLALYTVPLTGLSQLVQIILVLSVTIGFFFVAVVSPRELLSNE